MLSLGLSLTALPLRRTGWTPAALFGGGGAGLWLDPSDMTSLAQDGAGSVPVTAVGQPVGFVRDQSGFGNHALQTIAGRRPVLVLDGTGKRCLALDGIDDNLVVPAVAWGGSNEVTIVLALSASSTGLQAGILRGGGTASPTRFGVIKQSDNRVQSNSAGTAVATVSHASVVTGAPEVYSVSAKISAPSLALRRNGVLSAQSTASQGTGTYLDQDMTIGSWGGGQFFTGNLYGMVIINRALSPAELAQAEAWAASRCGVVLP